jgi:hypothetical protein
LSQRIELPFPELAVFFNPFGRAFHRSGGETAAMDAAIFSAFDELCARKHAQVFRHSWKRHFIWRGEIADGGFALREAREDAATGGVGKRSESIIQSG